jgi:hypothetical protein
VVPAENICSNHPSVSKFRRPVFAPIIAHAPEDRKAIRINAMISTGEATGGAFFNFDPLTIDALRLRDDAHHVRDAAVRWRLLSS